MINTKHTPEPWWIPTGYYTYIQGMSNGVTVPIAACTDNSHADAPNRENFSRIVACVNALAGIEDPATYIATLKAQRDDLLEACRSANGDMKWAEREANANFRSSIILCDAAIANATK